MRRTTRNEKAMHESAGVPSQDDAAEVLTELALTGPAPYLIRRLHQMVTAFYTEEMADYGVTAAQYAALSVVVDTPNLDQNTTAYLAGVDRTTIVGVINRLVRKGLLKRTILKTDRRVRLLKPTPAGIRFMRRVSAPVGRISARVLAACPPAERDSFCDIMRRLLREHLRTNARQLSVDVTAAPIRRTRRRLRSP